MVPDNVTPFQQQVVSQKSSSEFDLLAQLSKTSLKGLWISRDTKIQISSYNSLIGVSLIGIRYRLLTASGDIIDDELRHIPNSDRSAKTDSFGIGTGYLLSAFVYAVTGIPRRGQTWIILSLVNNKENINTFYLTSGYITAEFSPHWPDSDNRTSVEGPGVPLSVAVTQPAAGAEWSITVPTGARWKLRTVRSTLVTAVAVATRQAGIIVDDGSNVLFLGYSGDTEIASLTVGNNAAGFGTDRVKQQNDTNFNIPDGLVLFQGWRIRSTTANLQAADQYSGIRILVEELIEV